MKRTTLAAGLLACLGLLAAPAARADDSVIYNDRAMKKSVRVEGAIQEETVLGIKIRVGKDDKVIPAEDVEHVNYKLPPPNPSQTEVDNAYATETVDAAKPDLTPEARAAALANAVKAYQALDKQFSGKEAASEKRYIQYRIALVAVRLAKDDPKKADDAIKALTDYKAANKGGWEILPCVRTLTALLEQKGDIKAAKEAYEELAANDALPAEVRLAGNLKAVKLLMRAGDFKGAQDKLEGVAGDLKADDPQRAYVTVYLAQSRMAQNKLDKEVEDDLKAVAAGGDDGAKGLAHNALGEFYERAKKPDEAFWHYLRVDVLYNQDREEDARALYHLWKLFGEARKDPVKSQQCYDRLVSPAFAGTEYQTRALDEKAKESGGDKKSP
jgi:hypothetical protein